MSTNHKPVRYFFLLSFALLILNGVVYGGEGLKLTKSLPEELHFTLLHTNDEHSSLIPHTSTTDYRSAIDNPSIGGYARLASLTNKIREEKRKDNEQVLLVSAGDFLGGTAFSWLAPRGLAVELAIKQKLGYDAVTIGNHEYDYGTEVLARYLQAAGYPKSHEITPVLASNTEVYAEHPLAQQDLYRKYHIVELDNGLKIGFFGLIGKNAISVSTNTHPVLFNDQVKTAEEAVRYFNDLGVDIVIALSHSGVDEDQIIAKKVEGIDLIVGGHSHTVLKEPQIVGSTIIVQAGSYLEYMGMLELSYNPKTKILGLRNRVRGQPFLIPIDSSISDDPTMTALIKDYLNELNNLIQYFTYEKYSDVLDVIAKSNFTIPTRELQESELGNFVTDAMRFIASDYTGERVDVAIQANGSIRGSLIPGSMNYSEGLVSTYDLAALVGLGYGSDGYAGYPIVSVYLTGDEILRVLEVAALMQQLMGDNYFLQFSGLRYDYNPKDVVLFHLPIKNTPIPSTRAIKKAEVYIGRGVQTNSDDGYVRLKQGDSKLYHVVTDSYILSFLPKAGELLPQLEIVPKDHLGNPVPIEAFDGLIVYKNDLELKVWETVLDYAAMQPQAPDGTPVISDYYSSTSGRINRVSTIPIVVWLGLFFMTLLLLILAIIKRIRTRSRALLNKEL